MATKLEKPVTREVTVKDVNGVEGSVNVTITADGITLRGKGTKRELSLPYTALAVSADTPDGMPKKFADNKLGWLVDRKSKSDAPTA